MNYSEMHANRIDKLAMRSMQICADLTYLIEKTDNTLKAFADVERRSVDRMSDEEFFALLGRKH